MPVSKKVFFKIHSWIGIKLSILFFIVCFSGTLAVFSHEMDWLFIPEMRAYPQPTTASKNDIVQNIQNQYPGGRMTFWMASEEPYLCDIIYVTINGQRHYVFANPYTGAIQGNATLTFQRFFRDLHYFLFIPFQIGNFTVLIFGFLLFISLVTALMFYKKWYKKLFKLTINKGKLVFFRSLHRLVGVWSVPFMMLFSITSIWYFVERTNIGNISEIANPTTPTIQPQNSTPVQAENLCFKVDYDRSVDSAQSAITGIQVKDILPPSQPDKALYINGKSDVPLVRNRANRVYLDPVTYDIVKIRKAEFIDTITWLNDIADPLHFGYWGGLITKTIWFIAGLAISSLILSGIWISLKRNVKARIKTQQMGIWKYINWLVYLIMLYFMYQKLITTYDASAKALVTISAGWLLFSFTGWYFFDYKLKRTVNRELRFGFR